MNKWANPEALDTIAHKYNSVAAEVMKHQYHSGCSMLLLRLFAGLL